MPGYKTLETEYFGKKCNVLLRLNRAEHVTLKERLNETLNRWMETPGKRRPPL